MLVGCVDSTTDVMQPAELAEIAHAPPDAVIEPELDAIPDTDAPLLDALAELDAALLPDATNPLDDAMQPDSGGGMDGGGGSGMDGGVDGGTVGDGGTSTDDGGTGTEDGGTGSEDGGFPSRDGLGAQARDVESFYACGECSAGGNPLTAIGPSILVLGLVLRRRRRR